MSGRRLPAILFLGAAAIVAVLLILIPGWVAGSVAPGAAAGWGSALIAACAILLLWLAVDRLILGKARALAAEASMVTVGNGAELIPEQFGPIAPVAHAFKDMAGRFRTLRTDTDRRIAEATRRADEQAGQFAALLRDLHEGVLVCNLKHQILLYNEAARALLQAPELGLGRSLAGLVTREPVQHTLERLTRRVADGRHHTHVDGTTAGFVTSTADGRLLQGHMAVILADEQRITGYVVTLDDATRELATLARRDMLLRAATEDVRSPLTNLAAAAEMLEAHPDLSPDERASFDRIIISASRQLNASLERITTEYRAGISAAWPMDDIHTGNLFALLAERTARRGGPEITVTGLPHWLHGDSYSLVVLLSRLSNRISAATGAKSMDVSAEPDPKGHFVYADLSWKGDPLPSDALDTWRSEPLADALAGLTVGDLLDHHGSDMWSERAAQGCSRLRLPLPPAQEVHGRRTTQVTPRPEFFDFDLLHQPLQEGEHGRTRLKALSFVVFDTETTGLAPSQGDELVSIAGVRIINGRILTGETFQSLINPGRPIPASSTAIHGVTDAMVEGAPKAEDVLPQFRAFIGDSVLVAHNAAFDLKFLKMKQKAAGVLFDVPVLDTMILSRQIQGEDGDHTLDGIAARLGLPIMDRHSALGDALATAAIFLHFIDLLEERGIETLDDAIRRSNMAMELIARERHF
ncbi:3'-5' exonuclease [Indioceanicola profundi]|uniref:3'-5' exonuclease n=1 Tax=Indioceanicola profundi TaxID=2220096 RepID=UPI000E6AAB1C|nr:exonuclease domain-containing protein [Indioceanicola profundi]